MNPTLDLLVPVSSGLCITKQMHLSGSLTFPEFLIPLPLI